MEINIKESGVYIHIAVPVPLLQLQCYMYIQSVSLEMKEKLVQGTKVLEPPGAKEQFSAGKFGSVTIVTAASGNHNYLVLCNVSNIFKQINRLTDITSLIKKKNTGEPVHLVLLSFLSA